MLQIFLIVQYSEHPIVFVTIKITDIFPKECTTFFSSTLHLVIMEFHVDEYFHCTHFHISEEALIAICKAQN